MALDDDTNRKQVQNASAQERNLQKFKLFYTEIHSL